MIFIHADLEENVMEQDLTRINASKINVTSVEPYPVTAVNIQVSDGPSVNVFSANQKDWILDWEYSYTADIDATNYSLYWTENGVDFTADLAIDTYTLAQLLTEIQTKMNAASAVDYTLSVNNLNQVSISWTTGQKVVLDLNRTLLWKALGYVETVYTKPSGNRLIKSRLSNWLPKKVAISVVTIDPDDVLNTNTYSKSFYVKSYSERFSGVLAKDSDLQLIEHDILQWVPDGKNTYKSQHLQVVNDIVEWFDRKSFVNLYDEKFVISDFYDKSELIYWAKYQALYYIFNSNNNAVNDIFAEKAMTYKKLANKHRRRIFKVDLDANDTINFDEMILTNHIKLVPY